MQNYFYYDARRVESTTVNSVGRYSSTSWPGVSSSSDDLSIDVCHWNMSVGDYFASRRRHVATDWASRFRPSSNAKWWARRGQVSRGPSAVDDSKEPARWRQAAKTRSIGVPKAPLGELWLSFCENRHAFDLKSDRVGSESESGRYYLARVTRDAHPKEW